MDTRILWLTENYPPQRGGMAQSSDRIVSHLRQAGWTIDIVHFINRADAFRFTQQINGWYLPVPFEDSEAHTLNRAWEMIRHKPTQAIVCFGGYLPMLAAPVFAKWMNVPLFTCIRGNDFDAAVFTPRKRDLMRDALEASAVVSAVSSDKVEKIQKLYPSVDARFIPNGIDLHQWSPSASEKEFSDRWRTTVLNGKKGVGIFGQLKAKKGVDFLFDALQESVLLHQLHFLLIGECTEELTSGLTARGVSFTHIEFLDRFELLKYYICCDALVIPSFYDGMPNVLLEAGALGIPVIASAVDGMKDVITDRQSGLLFTAGDAAACKKAFFDFVELSDTARTQLGVNLRRVIESTYTVKHETQQYDELFKEFLDSPSTPLRVHHHQQRHENL
jgi:glycogen(starch) synthase